MRLIWRTARGRAGGLAAAGIAVLATLAILQPTGHGPATAGAAVSADLSLTISDSPDPVLTGAVLTYAIKVHNAGLDPATNTTVTDGLPSGVSLVSATPSAGSCTVTSGKEVCNLGTVTTTVDRTITIKATVKKKSGEMTNSASVTSDVTDPTLGNNLDSELTKIAIPPKPPKPPTCAGQTVTIFGTPGPDVLVGTRGDDVIFAEAGDDFVLGLHGGDFICAGPGSDAVRGGAGNDAAFGGHGSDFIHGRRGDDGLHGGRGRDRLRGGGGDDLLAGGKGFDRCRGGGGLDARRSCER